MYGFSSFLMLLGRFGLATIFLLSGIGKFLDYDNVAGFMASKELGYIPVLLICAALIEIAGALGLIVGLKTRWVAALLFLYLIPVTILIHNFWQADAAAFEMQRINFLKNLAIMGGLLYVVANGAGRFAMDSCCKKE
jgi:putative oxidoreductase